MKENCFSITSKTIEIKGRREETNKLWKVDDPFSAKNHFLMQLPLVIYLIFCFYFLSAWLGMSITNMELFLMETMWLNWISIQEVTFMELVRGTLQVLCNNWCNFGMRNNWTGDFARFAEGWNIRWELCEIFDTLMWTFKGKGRFIQRSHEIEELPIQKVHWFTNIHYQ